ncbi:hypothetical protein TI39_contig4326g00004 [Zymoseptoria brevis]|uniref:Cyanovirin-N domain-containing protein n=1 Tax=Zymoseptoria brevis TaxID=1047168 RepID=A0A0F4G7R3_9PEZI|nr:hypothetical protein TI39_contig4326g00004 [Zymoseptoria brevis]
MQFTTSLIMATAIFSAASVYAHNTEVHWCSGTDKSYAYWWVTCDNAYGGDLMANEFGNHVCCLEHDWADAYIVVCLNLGGRPQVGLHGHNSCHKENRDT